MSGELVGGKYRIVRPLGEGGTATVFEAEHALTSKRFALKRLHRLPIPGFPEQRLLYEARAASRVRHHNVVEIYDVVEESGSVCLVMELLEGEPLSERMAREPMPLHEFIGLLLAAMRGLAAVHAVNVVHRDVKPENIFLARETGHADFGSRAEPPASTIVPKVIDFGICKVFDPDAPTLTQTGVSMGTPRYVSYEQLVGTRDVDARTDIYSVAAVLYEAAAGRPPYLASSLGEQAVAFAVSVPPAPRSVRPELPGALDDLIRRALAKEREERPGSMQAFIDELAGFARAEAFDPPLLTFAPALDKLSGTVQLAPTKPASWAGTPAVAVGEMRDTPVTSPGPQRANAGAKREPWRRVARVAVALALIGTTSLVARMLLAETKRGPESMPTSKAHAQPASAPMQPSVAPTSSPALTLGASPSAIAPAVPATAPKPTAGKPQEVPAPARPMRSRPRESASPASTAPVPASSVPSSPPPKTATPDTSLRSTGELHRAPKLQLDQF